MALKFFLASVIYHLNYGVILITQLQGGPRVSREITMENGEDDT